MGEPKHGVHDGGETERMDVASVRTAGEEEVTLRTLSARRAASLGSAQSSM